MRSLCQAAHELKHVGNALAIGDLADNGRADNRAIGNTGDGLGGFGGADAKADNHG